MTSIHRLAGNAPPHIRRTIGSRVERQRQTTQTSHQHYDNVPSAGRLKSRNCFIRTATPLDSSPNYTRLKMWNNQLIDAQATIKLGVYLEAAEAMMPAVSDPQWFYWRSLNRLRTGIGRAKTTTMRWGCIDNTQSVNCDSGEPQTMAHLLCCRLLDEHCYPE